MKKAFLLLIFFLIVSGTALSQTTPPKPTEYILLAPLPNISTQEGGGECVKDGKPCATTRTFLPGFFKLIIGLATALAVIMIVIGGLKYIATATTEGKGDARETISNAIWGLLLAISAWLILYTINPALVNLNFNIEPQKIATVTKPPTTPPPSGSCLGCVELGEIPHKKPPEGCLPQDPSKGCQIQGELRARLYGLWKKFPALNVSESWPPTVIHQDPCHKAGTCVDVSRFVDTDVYKFIVESKASQLTSVYEIKDASRKAIIINASCTSPKPIEACKALLDKCIALVPTINEEHYSVYLSKPARSPCQ